MHEYFIGDINLLFDEQVKCAIPQSAYDRTDLDSSPVAEEPAGDLTTPLTTQGH